MRKPIRGGKVPILLYDKVYRYTMFDSNGPAGYEYVVDGKGLNEEEYLKWKRKLIIDKL